MNLYCLFMYSNLNKILFTLNPIARRPGLPIFGVGQASTPVDKCIFLADVCLSSE